MHGLLCPQTFFSVLPHGQNSGSSPEGSWNDLIQHYRSSSPIPAVGQEEAPAVGQEEAPPLAPAAAAVDVGAEIYQPLLQDPLRRQELNERLLTNLIGEDWSLERIESIINKQLRIEKEMEFTLLSNGFPADYLLNNRNSIRGFVFYPYGKPLTEKTYSHYLHIFETVGPQGSPPYK